ncbi:adenylosuccinate synthase [Leptogranulimonas caecicola]|jgi:adenylosuccinate synthase|uniref:Adenylosuccinate synthetase n=2 Tax=Coriobacteriales TaxID=84999 RepID=A0A4S2F2D7_9ACTN|nr:MULTISPECIES: adenylosuccinate synthase [Atopobiaceae]MCI8675275.1 adenylosuccinate synthase [Atopobiaceae bacterium]TGY63108.1 adenylosuccinate synthase [Muricaecibacterium torontonense]BCV19488.1 adenylosuccinate synthetase [Atopobiaceae bacterium P1]BDC90151.1 adenylosuccinate synthetase [Leptogranulimonas caecicola]
MASTILVGTQWGDEGKGKVTDLISGEYDVVCRCQGGANAGHTVVANGHKFGLHQIPSGVMYEGVVPVIGNGCIVDPSVVLEEFATLDEQGVSYHNLKISGNAHIVMPYHKDLDGANERRLGKNLIGTTRRGVGPCYSDKVSRIGLRMQDMLDEKIFREKLETALAEKNPILEKIYGLPGYTVDQICETYLPYAERLRPYIIESSRYLNEAITEGKNILFEGSQATMLDIDFGTYPFVTSSNCTAGGAITGSGVGPKHIDRVLGIAKAYLTRVGSGPFPTELPQGDEIGELLCEVGHEYGVTTGRKRRCGWYDAVVVNYAARVNGLTDLAVTKLDVLSVLDTIKVCIAYDVDGVRYTTVPEHQSLFYKAKPVYIELPGWKCDISGVRNYTDLPREAKDYIDLIERLSGVPVSLIAVGPDREQTINRHWR